MFHKISPLILSILLLVALLGSKDNLGLLVISSGVLIVFTTFINYRRFGFYWPHLLLPIFFLGGVNASYAIIPSSTVRFAFLAAAALSFFFMERQLGKESHFLQNMFLISTFLIYLGLFAAAFYFVDLSFWWTIAAVCLATWALTTQGFAGITLPTKKYFSALIIIVATEAAIGLVLWPTHFLVNAIVLFFLYYLLWTFALAAFFGKLSRKKVYWQFGLVAIVLILTLSTAAWQPLR